MSEPAKRPRVMIDYSESDGICTLRLNNPPLNAIGYAMIEQLVDVVERANSRGGVRGIIITGSTEHFSAGADVNIFREIDSAEQAVRASRIYQGAFDAVEGSGKPVVAAVAGKVMGCAVELAMACNLRVCTEGTTFSCPEVKLGINPGAGGCQRLARLIGPEAALEMLLSGRPIGAQKALELGLVDSVCGAGRLLESARGLLGSRRPRRTSLLTEKVCEADRNRRAYRQAERVIESVRPEVIGPRMILDAVRTGIEESYQAGLATERRCFARCMETAATRNKIYLFFATRKTSKVSELEGIDLPRVGTVAVVGAGSMGTGIAQAAAAAGFEVAVMDREPAAVQKALGRIRKSVERKIGAEKMTRSEGEALLRRIRVAEDWQQIGAAGIVIEAVFEDVAVKQGVLREIARSCAEQTIIASNTSTIDLDVLAEGLVRPERLVGLHFFNPAHSMPLVEVVRREGAAGEVIGAAMKFARDIRKTPILVRNRPGFLVNRIFIPYLKEAFRLLEDGAEPRAVDSAMEAFGFSMGPLSLVDMAGIDILAMSDRQMCAAYGHHLRLSRIATALVERGCLGQKSGSGVYSYEEGDYTTRDSAVSGEVIAAVRKQTGKAPRKLGSEQITERLVLRMVNEAFYVLDERVARRESDIDVAMVLGTGFPDFRGGVLKYARELGIENVKGRLESLAERFGGRFRPCGIMQDIAGE